MSDPRPLLARELCDPSFLGALQHLRLVARRVAPRGRFAEQRSADLGGGFEFRDYRPYTPGDDLRAIDWNIYRRLQRVFVRLFEEQEDLPLYLMPDVSASAWFEEPPRVVAGLRCALGLAAVSLGQHDRVGVFPFAEDLVVHVRPQAGKNRVIALAGRLAELRPGGPTNVARALARFSSLRMREGLVVVISDFFDPAGLDAVVAALGQIRHRLLLVRLTRRSDADPSLSGDLRLVDCEGTGVAEVSFDAAARARYLTAFTRFEETLAAFALSRGAGLVKLDVEAEVLPQLEDLFASGTLSV